MKTPDYFSRTWTFLEALSGPPSVYKAYPSGTAFGIEQQPDGTFKMTWIDGERQRHVLSGLGYENGSLTGTHIQDPVTGLFWRIRILDLLTPLGGSNRDRIQGIVSSADSGAEGNLSGTWGAESPPKPEESGQPSDRPGV